MLLKMTIEIVDYPLNIVIFHSYVNVYQRVTIVFMGICFTTIKPIKKIKKTYIYIHNKTYISPLNPLTRMLLLILPLWI